MRSNCFIAMLTAISIVAVGCETDLGQEDLDLGRVVEGVYTNDYLGLTLPIPDGWFVASVETKQHLSDLGEAVAVGDDA